VNIVVGSFTSIGQASVNLEILSGGAFSPYNVANSSANFVTILSSPVLLTLTPTGGYQSTSITVAGSNCITPAQGGLYTAVINGVATSSCSIMSSSTWLIVMGASPAGSNVSVGVTFNAGGNMAQASMWGFVMVGSPAVVSVAPAAGYISSTFTVVGSSFISLAQDMNASCTAFLVNATTTAAASCSLLDTTRVILTIGWGTTAGGKSITVIFHPLGISLISVAPIFSPL
jgi:hypothetical protein